MKSLYVYSVCILALGILIGVVSGFVISNVSAQEQIEPMQEICDYSLFTSQDFAEVDKYEMAYKYQSHIIDLQEKINVLQIQ